MRLITLLLLFFSPLLAEEKAPSKTVYIYDKDMEGSLSKTTWTIEEKDQTLHIQGESGRGETLLITTPPLNTQSFSYEAKNKSNGYYIHREGSNLYAKRIDGRGAKQKEFHIGGDFWIQEFDFSMRAFILSAADSLKFQIVHPQKLSLHQMVATKSSDLESLEIKGKSFQAVKVKITLTGFKKMFWKAELWFDQKTGDLLKYMANEGPNTPMSVITLFSKTVED